MISEFEVDREHLRSHGNRGGVAKKVAIELCCEFTTQSQRQVGVYFGYTSNGAVGKQRNRLRELMATDKELRRSVERLRKKLLT